MNTPYTPTPQSPVVRLGWLDGLRGWAILLVVGIHVWIKVNLGVEQGISLASDKDMGVIFGNGTWGVQLFYTISGFTMCYMWHYYKQSPHKIRDFLIRRFCRIAPMMYVAILVAVLSSTDPLSGVRVLLSTLFITDLAPYSIQSYAPAGTTIDLEMSFYVLFPFLVPHMHKWQLPVIFAGIHIIFTVFAPHMGYAFQEHFILTQAVMFVIGGFVYHLVRQQWGKSLLDNYWSMPVLFIFSLWFDDHYSIPFHFIFMGGVFGGLMLSAAYTKTPLFDNTFMRFMGVLSFSIYLIHPTVVAAIAGELKIYGGLGYGFIGMILTLMPTTAICYITYKTIEQPGIRFGKKWIKNLQQNKDTT